MKPEPAATQQFDRLARRIAMLHEVDMREANAMLIERCVRLGKSGGNLKFLRIVRRLEQRHFIPFRDALSMAWERCASAIIAGFALRIRQRLSGSGDA